MYPHRIRLGGPWECVPLSRFGPGELPPPLHMTLPCRWAEGGLADFSGHVRFSRRFGYPGRIDDYERVWLTAESVDASAQLILNGTPIGRFTLEDVPFEADVTALLRQRNELTVEVEGGANGGLRGEVALEVRCLAFLRNIRVDTVSGALQIRGEVVGTADRPLELYAVFGRRTADYATVTPTSEGTPFRLAAELPAVADEHGANVLKLDLVNGASVWYTFEQVCAPRIAERPES